MNLPSKCIFPSKEPAAIVASVVPLLHVYTLMMSLQVRLSNELLVAVRDWAWEWILSARIMGLHVSFKVVASSKKLATSFDMTLEVCIFLGGKLSRSPGPCYYAWTSEILWW